MCGFRAVYLLTLLTMGSVAFGAETSAQAFDVEQATAAWLASIPPRDVARANAYVDTGYLIKVLVVILDGLIALLLLRFGWSSKWRTWAERIFRSNFLQAYIYVPIYVLATFLLSLPLLIYSDYHVEHKYGLATQTFTSWFIEQLQGVGIALIAVTVFLSLFYLVVRLSPKNWWLWSAGLVTGFLAIMLFLAPVLIEPVFNDYPPMDEGPLKQRILSLARANGMRADDVKQVDASRQTNRVSANVSGLFGTTRIALNDNLLQRASPAGVEAVMAHEIGHYVLNHSWKTLTAYTLLFLFGFALASAVFNSIVRRFGSTWGVRGISDYAGFPLLYAIASVFFLLTTPLFYSITRSMEAEADLFAINATRNPDAWAEIALLTSDYRKPHPPRWEERYLNHHPSPYARIRMAMVWKAQNLPEPKRKAE